MYNSPIPGRNDKTPSFCLYVRDNQIKWCDHGLTDQFGNKPENLVQYMEGLELTSKGFYDAKRLIDKNISRQLTGKPLKQLRMRPTRDSAPYIQDKEYENFELTYWNRFEISKSELLFEDIRPLKSLSWSGINGEPNVRSTPSDPAFVYWWDTNPASWKLYRPLTNKRDKFRQENVHGVIEGWNSMTKSIDGPLDILFILSSTKDRLVVKHAFGDPEKINGINPRGEADFADIMQKAPEIKKLAKRVIIMFDADDPGFTGSKKLADLTGFEFYDFRDKLGFDPDRNKIKDFADFVDKYRGNRNYSELKQVINKTIQ